MSAPPPNSSFPSHPLRPHQPLHQQQQLSLSSSSPAAGVNLASSPASGSGTHPSAYYPSSYATVPSEASHQLYHYSSSLGTGTGFHNSLPSISLSHMARLHTHFSQLAPSCVAHLADQNAVPILSTTSHTASSALSSLSAAFVQAHDTASRLGLGIPLRVTLTTGNGAAVIQTGTVPEPEEDPYHHHNHNHNHLHHHQHPHPHQQPHHHHYVRGAGNGAGEEIMLVGTVVAPGDRLAEARVASWGVEDVARKVQRYMRDRKSVV